MSDRYKTLRITEEEELLLREQARAIGIYEHGFIRAALRFALGLPIKSEVASAIRERDGDVTHTPTLTRR